MNQRSFLYYVTTVLRLALYPLTLLYGAIVWLRNRLYDVKFFSSIGFSLPVITVGNLSTGGTGKTPHIEYLIDLLKYRYVVGTMSRGYKRFTKGFLIAQPGTNALKIGDEPMQYYLKYPEAVISVAEERLTGIPYLLQRRPDIDIILLDDAFQHRSVRAGLNVLITDYNQPFYKDYILPFGNLREGRSAYKRAEIIIVSKCPDQLSRAEADTMKRAINPLPHQPVFFTSIQYGTPYDFFTREVAEIAQSHAILVCGIARPEPLAQFLAKQVAGLHTLTYKDHHYFVTSDIEEIKAAYSNWDVPNKIIITTEKDAARLYLHYELLLAWQVKIVVMPIKVHVLFNEGPLFDSIIYKYIESIIEPIFEDDSSNEAY